MKKLSRLALLGFLAVSLTTAAKANIVANYSFSGSSRASFDSDLNSAASAFTDGPDWVASIDPVRGNPTPSISVDSAQTDGSTQSGAITANDYYTFTITPNPGVTLNLTTLSFDFANYTNSGVFPTENIFARSSFDNFSANLAAATTVSAASAGTFTNVNISLTAAGFQNVTAPIEFRLYIFDSTTNVDKGALVDNVILQSVPEPSVYMLLGVGILLCGQRFLRRKAA